MARPVGVSRAAAHGPFVHRRGPGGRGPDYIRSHGRRYAWGSGFWFYNGYYWGDCQWLYNRAVVTGSPYWWDRYDQCRYWE